MINYNTFKSMFETLDSFREPEIEFHFKNAKYSYMLIKHNGYISFGRIGENKIIKYKDLEELYNNVTVDRIVLKRDWNEIEDIIIDMTFSVINNKEEILKVYGFKI